MRVIEKRRTLLVFLIDTALAAISFPLSLFLRLGTYHIDTYLQLAAVSSGIFAAVAAVVVWQSKHQRIPWRYVSVGDALLLMRTSVLINGGFLAISFLTTRLDGVPRSAILINVLVLGVLYIGARLGFRLFHEGQIGLRFLQPLAKSNRTRVLLVGATDEAEAFVRKMARDPNAAYEVVGIVEDDLDRPVGTRIRGVKVVSRLSGIEAYLDLLSREGTPVSRIVIADPDLRGEPVRRLLDITNSRAMQLNRLPEISHFQSATDIRQDVRPVDVADLLTRPQAHLDRIAMGKMIGGGEPC